MHPWEGFMKKRKKSTKRRKISSKQMRKVSGGLGVAFRKFDLDKDAPIADRTWE